MQPGRKFTRSSIAATTGLHHTTIMSLCPRPSWSQQTRELNDSMAVVLLDGTIVVTLLISGIYYWALDVLILQNQSWTLCKFFTCGWLHTSFLLHSNRLSVKLQTCRTHQMLEPCCRARHPAPLDTNESTWPSPSHS